MTEVGAANLSRDTVSSAQLVLDELLLQRAVSKRSRWQQAVAGTWKFVALPLVKWTFGILAAVVTAILLVLLGIKGA
jgi:hypothetical protein